MKRLLASLILITAVASLSGCYYDPGYSYVRSSGYGGDAYYGQGAATYYAAPGYYDGYYGSGYYGSDYYGCCYQPGLSVGISSGWYGGSRDGRPYRHDEHRDGYRGHDGDAHRGHAYPRAGVRAQPQRTQPQRTQPQPSSNRGSRRDGEDRRARTGNHRN